MHQGAKAEHGEKAGNETRQTESSKDNGDGEVGLEDEDPYRNNVKEGKKPVRGPAFEENTQPKSILKKTETVGTSEPQANTRKAHACGCVDIYDHMGKKQQQACEVHKSDPMRSVHSLPPKIR